MEPTLRQWKPGNLLVPRLHRPRYPGATVGPRPLQPYKKRSRTFRRPGKRSHRKAWIFSWASGYSSQKGASHQEISIFPHSWAAETKTPKFCGWKSGVFGLIPECFGCFPTRTKVLKAYNVGVEMGEQGEVSKARPRIFGGLKSICEGCVEIKTMDIWSSGAL